MSQHDLPWLGQGRQQPKKETSNMETQTQTEQHTPGPWTTDHGHIWADGLLLATMKERCVESIQKGAVQYAPQQANAALIAAAPELYEALMKLREVIGCWNLNSEDYESLVQPVIRDVDAALAHADNKDYHPREVQA